MIYLSADQLPTTATGKVQKFRLVEQAHARLEANADLAR
jgi:acyl-CoA synthetase (AMP-forming)/AMP-acid ligase II